MHVLIFLELIMKRIVLRNATVCEVSFLLIPNEVTFRLNHFGKLILSASYFHLGIYIQVKY